VTREEDERRARAIALENEEHDKLAKRKYDARIKREGNQPKPKLGDRLPTERDSGAYRGVVGDGAWNTVNLWSGKQ
jgi:hypothetical protein